MKTKLFFALPVLLFSTALTAQTCYSTPDGSDANNWSYKDYVIPNGYKIDSVKFSATRAGYPTSQYDFIFDYCAGTTTYSQSIAVEPWNYTTDTSSEYNHWINLTSFNYTSTGVVRVHLPTNAGAVWNQVCFAISNSGTCFTMPDGTDGNGWSYKDYIIPAGNKIDSVYMNAIRTGYPANQCIYIFDYCAGTTIYSQSIAVEPWNYTTATSSEYNHWINLVSFNYTATGVARVHLPTNAGAVWNQVCFAVSQNTTGIKEISNTTSAKVYPNPTNSTITIESNNSIKEISITDLLGKQLYKAPASLQIDLSNFESGTYLLKITNADNSTYTQRIIKN
jgi:hypothetical protein